MLSAIDAAAAQATTAVRPAGVLSQVSRVSMALRRIREAREPRARTAATPMTPPASRPKRMAIWATCVRSLGAVVAGETETACRDVVAFSACWVYTACAPWSSVCAEVAFAVASSIWRCRAGLRDGIGAGGGQRLARLLLRRLRLQTRHLVLGLAELERVTMDRVSRDVLLACVLRR